MSFEGMDLAGARARIEPLAAGEWLLIDAAVLANAVYFAERSRARREDGAAPDNDPPVEVTGPRLWDFAASLLDRFRPSHALAAWDGPKSWRKAAPESGGVPNYKAQRPQKPIGLRELLRLAPDVFRALGVESVSVEGFEADDVIASAAYREVCVIVSNDKDFAQCLAWPSVRWWNPMPSSKTDVLDSAAVERGEWVDAAKVFEKFRVHPDTFTAYQAIAGDASDNVAGCPGIGAVGAASLVGDFGSIAEIYDAVERGDPKVGKYAAKLLAGDESVYAALRAVTLDTTLPVNAPPVGERQEFDQGMFVNPFKKPSTEALNTATRAEMAPGSEEPSKAPEVEPSAEPAAEPEKPAARPVAPEPEAKPDAKPERPRAPKEAVPTHDSIPVRWRGMLRQHIDLAAASPLRNELMIAARNAGHLQVPTGAPSMLRGRLLDEIACLIRLLTGVLPWSPVERPAWSMAAPSDDEPFKMEETKTAEPEPEPEPTPPEPTPEPETTPETKTPEPETKTPVPDAKPGTSSPRRILCIDCQPRSGDYVELSDFLSPVYRWVESQRKAEHWLVLPYSEGPRLAAAQLAHGLRHGTLVLPSCLVVRRAHPGAVEAIAELIPHYERADVVEASR